MASQSTRYALTTIGFAHGFGAVLSRDASNHFAVAKAQKVADTAKKAMAQWPGQVDFSPNDVAAMGRRIARIERLGFEADTIHTLEGIAMLSDLLVRIHARLKDEVKRGLVTDVIQAVAELHNFYAPVEDGPREMKMYERGSKLAEIFNELRG